MGFSVRQNRRGGAAASPSRGASGAGRSGTGSDRRARSGGVAGFAARPALGAALDRGPEVSITIDGRSVRAHLGESVAAVLIAEGPAALRRTRGGDPRGVFCGMGVCFDCLAVVDGVPNTRTCMAWVTDGMTVEHQAGFGPAAV
ncbi:(2Fe-2S)-binding protein [Patulibacter sp.]|uniref:(2Fe-2S)-binding protein n=1 Tax=Patulibacter sp. TaxID=1912859 RepID=UPI002721AA78|nr:(2Fe-2S)-binding protein [Patulibacter sp.]MDO9407376.1 (2Fe-2S)-binding protein [Patulibacter sp.]